jgi:transcriptional regulator with XRE-family HTH domain
MDMDARLRELRVKRGIRSSQLADESGVPQKTVDRVLKGETKNPRIETLQGIASALGVTVGWVLGEKNYEFSPDDRDELRRLVDWGLALLKATEPTTPPVLESNVVPVRLTRKPPARAARRGNVQSNWREFFDRFENEDVDIPTQYEQDGANLVFRAEGDSMESEIRHGDLLYVREEADSRAARGRTVVCIVEGSPYVKRLELAGSRIRLNSENERFPPMVFAEQAVEWGLVGIVAGLSRDVR